MREADQDEIVDHLDGHEETAAFRIGVFDRRRMALGRLAVRRPAERATDVVNDLTDSMGMPLPLRQLQDFPRLQKFMVSTRASSVVRLPSMIGTAAMMPTGE